MSLSFYLALGTFEFPVSSSEAPLAPFRQTVGALLLAFMKPKALVYHALHLILAMQK